MRKNPFKRLFDFPEPEQRKPEPLTETELTELWNEVTWLGVAPDTDVTALRRSGGTLKPAVSLFDRTYVIEVTIDDPERPEGIGGKQSFRIPRLRHYPEYRRIVEEQPMQTAITPTRSEFAELLGYLRTVRTSPEYTVIVNPMSRPTDE
jgi:hypothetical protein